jgi:acetyl-CoA carboxylase biotin carboxyl carrier protein
VSDPRHLDARRPERSAAERSADHAAIDRLSTELLPSLMAKLGATSLGELEVREGAWRVRLRRPAAGAAPTSGPSRERRPSERGADRTAPDRADRHAERPARTQHHGHDGASRSDTRGVATSPAVGIYRPRTDLTVGDRVRSGDRLGAVDMLGVAQEVLAPIDGIVGSSLAESGDAVEYGQELLVIEGAVTPAGSGA